ncbi:hypothetical protein FRB93_003918 [Tulasnella sp. JGI-2019a]|nr:hypothetical protein FRB93_003918 [Tulasnella sp. JGI-2019a]
MHNSDPGVTTASDSDSPPINETATTPTSVVDDVDPENKNHGIAFWLAFTSLMLSTFVSAMDVTSVSTVLPTIISKLPGEFTWVGSSYTLASTAFLPMAGGLAQIFGRKPIMLAALSFFAVGSAVCGSAKTLNTLIVGRVIQGVGSGGIESLTEIIVADIVPLSRRGVYIGLIGAVWTVACAAGPPIGGAFASVNWRWLFYMNVPLTGMAILGVVFCLHVKTPQDDLQTKLKRMDWIGNILIVAATSATIIGLTWGGVVYGWSSPRVVVPIVLGVLGLAGFLWYEKKVPTEPVVPWPLLSDRTSLSGYVTTFCHSFVVSGVLYFIPVYFQAVKAQSPIHSGVSYLAILAIMAPGDIVCGASVTLFGVYRPQNAIGWILSIVGVGLLSKLQRDTSTAAYIGYQIFAGLGLGTLFTAPTFPILAPQPLQRTANALALFIFARNFALTWGITTCSTILQNGLLKRLPQSLIAQLTASSTSSITARSDLAYTIIPLISTLPEPLKTQTEDAFADSLRSIWHVLLGVCGVGLLNVITMKEFKMRDSLEEEYGMKDATTKQKEGKYQAPDLEKILPAQSAIIVDHLQDETSS